MPFRSYRAASKDADWGQESPMFVEHINCGSLLRIADALEKMSDPYLQNLKTLEFYRAQYHQKIVEIGRMKRQIAALRGHNRKLRNETKSCT
jgi:hypothetical protein